MNSVAWNPSGTCATPAESLASAVCRPGIARTGVSHRSAATSRQARQQVPGGDTSRCINSCRAPPARRLQTRTCSPAPATTSRYTSGRRRLLPRQLPLPTATARCCTLRGALLSEARALAASAGWRAGASRCSPLVVRLLQGACTPCPPACARFRPALKRCVATCMYSAQFWPGLMRSILVQLRAAPCVTTASSSFYV